MSRAEKKYDKQIKELISRMTREEKIGQMLQIGTSIYKDKLDEGVVNLIKEGKVGSFLSVHGVENLNRLQRIAVEESRLGIPLFFGNDVIHGYRVIFPFPAGEACSFEPELAYNDWKMIAKESRANGTHVTWYPMVDISYDQRWGRGFEGAGEDVYLGCEFAKARVEGIQHGDLKDDDVLAACAKHYIAYGACQGGRDYNSVDISDNALYNIYLPPFRTAVDAGVEFVMTAFNDVNGIPCTANKKLLKDILRDELGFRGIVISDAGSLAKIETHGYTDGTESTAQAALDAGVDIEMYSSCYTEGLADTEENNKKIDEAVYKILELKFRLGLFDNPYGDLKKAEENTATPECMEMARTAAKRSMVLLENNGILPLGKKRISVIGKLADDKDNTIGGWVCTGKDESASLAVTVKEGLENCEDVEFVGYVDGYNYPENQDKVLENIVNGIYEHVTTSDEMIDEAIKTAKKSETVILVLGEPNSMNGEAKSRASIKIPTAQIKLLDELCKLNIPIVALVMAGRPLLVKEIADKTDAVIFYYSLGTQTGNAVADVLTGKYNPSAKLVQTIPSADGQCPTMHYSRYNTGNPELYNGNFYTIKYIDTPREPAYCFGYGKSYTEFSYKSFKTDKDEYKFGEKINIEVAVENTGKFDGEEVVQIYMRDMVGKTVRPIKQLIAFKKVMINKNSDMVVKFEVDTNKIGYYFENKYILESGDFKLFAGGSSDTVFEKKIKIN